MVNKHDRGEKLRVQSRGMSTEEPSAWTFPLAEEAATCPDGAVRITKRWEACGVTSWNSLTRGDTSQSRQGAQTAVSGHLVLLPQHMFEEIRVRKICLGFGKSETASSKSLYYEIP